MGPNVVVWFRKALRLHDNAALCAAVEDASRSGGTVIPVFCLDPHFVNSRKVGPLRWRFLLEAMDDLHRQLQKCNSGLFVLQGAASSELPQACKHFSAGTICFEKDTESFARTRDADVTRTVEGLGVKVRECHGHTLYNMDHLLQRCDHKPPKKYQAFLALLRQVGLPDQPRPAPTEALSKLQPPPWTDLFRVPKLDELLSVEDVQGLAAAVFPGGEAEGLRRLAAYCSDEDKVCGFQKPDGDPTTLVPYTTGLSPYLKFGCVSVRKFFWDVQAIYTKAGSHTQPPQSLHGQLFFREWFYLCSYVTPNWEQMEGNPLCRQVPWGRDPQLLQAWKEGRTGYPWIDAVMRQLHTIGWMHHLARHCVACFLTRGDLWQHWEEGAKVFEYYLVDADWALNVANWYWLSASAFFDHYERVYSPINFGKKYDPEGRFVRHYVPELRDMPARYVYEPWKAPLSIQQMAKCVVGVDYPAPIVDHNKAKEANMKKMKDVFDGVVPLGPPGAGVKAVDHAPKAPYQRGTNPDPTRPHSSSSSSRTSKPKTRAKRQGPVQSSPWASASPSAKDGYGRPGTYGKP